MTGSQIRSTAACIAALALLTTGCTVPDPSPATPSTTAAQALQQLESLPSLEDTKAQLTTAVAQIKDAANRLKPELRWQSLNGETNDYCQTPYEQSDGERVFLPDEVAPTDLSEPEWHTLLTAAKASAAALDATETQVMKDGPGNHDVGFYGPTGLFIKIAYQGNLMVSTYTGCRLPQNKKKPAS